VTITPDPVSAIRKLPARDAEVGREEMLPQHLARFAVMRGMSFFARRVVMSLEQVATSSLLL